jgi:hypothetical protein
VHYIVRQMFTYWKRGQLGTRGYLLKPRFSCASLGPMLKVTKKTSKLDD